jgi:hypothetical protein
MMQADSLAQLRDIQLPEPISWWPLAPGWWVLIILATGIFGWAGLLLIKRYRANLYRRQAALKLGQITTQPDFTSNQKLVLCLKFLSRQSIAPIQKRTLVVATSLALSNFCNLAVMFLFLKTYRLT